MRIGEGHAHGGKTVDVRCLHLLVAPEMADPMIEIIHRDEQDVGLGGVCGEKVSARGKSEGGEKEQVLAMFGVRTSLEP